MRISDTPSSNPHTGHSSVSVNFSRFALRCELVANRCVFTTTSSKEPIEVMVELPGIWYGGGELIHQQFPLNKIMLQSGPFLTFDNGPTGLSGKLTPAWFSSNGVLLTSDSHVDVAINQPPEDFPHFKWSFTADGRGAYSNRPFINNGLGDNLITFKCTSLDLKIIFSENAVEAYKKLVEHFGHPVETPPEELFAKPTWTTWARYKTAINQEVILQFADTIIQNDFPFYVIEIDDRWQVHYGDLDFDPQRFPNPIAMIDELHAKGFKVTAWVIPFFDPQSIAFAEAAKNGWLTLTTHGTPFLVPWWQGKGGLLDVTNPTALDWFFEQLKLLQARTGLDGFKFDAGEACFLPTDAVLYKKIHPNEYTHIYVNAIAKKYRLTEVRSGWKNQTAPIFFRQWDKTTSWGLDNGLHSVLTGVMALGLAGYPFILPDIIGGNEYDEKANSEMMIRWTQLNALLPAMQFSLAPWDYGIQSNEICRRYARLHVEFANKIFEIAKEATKNGEPIIRPIFWLDPADEQALVCDDEFLLGNDILVAPVVSPNQRSRDIYFPQGTWRDHWTKESFTGATLIKDYPAPLDVLPFFERCQFTGI